MSSSGPDPICRRRQSYIAPAVVLTITSLLLLLFSARFYTYVKSPNVDLHGKGYVYLYIPTGTDFNGLLKILKEKSVLKNERSFVFVAKRKHYDVKVKAGKYRINNGISNNELVNHLRSGKQVPVRLSLQNARNLTELAGKLGHQVEADSASLLMLFRDNSYLKQFGVNTENVFVLFIPNTYEIFWNTSARQLITKMSQEQKAFWNRKRQVRLDSISMNIQQVVTIASIIEKETNKDDEKPVMAGVYINRLHKNWPLQADPTVIYAWQDYSIKRVLARHLRIESPYNTYIHTGLPPGPICIPSVSSIDAVLNYKRHGYLFFCAKEDFSGYHNFATSNAEHSRNAKKYQKALDQMKIKQ